MKWRYITAHCDVSECGFYTRVKEIGFVLAFYRHGGLPSSTTGKPSDIVGKYKTPESANSACDRHAERARAEVAA